MDIILNLCIILVVIVLFILLKYTVNPYLYVGIIVISLLGLVLCVNTPLYYTTGVNTTIIYEGTQITNYVTEDIQQDFSTFNYVIELFYLMAFLGSVVFWSSDNKKNKTEYD